jgi:AcrR family transcriptional regulator
MHASDVAAPARETLTREAVIAATRALIVQEGLDAVSLRRVGAALGVTAPALYAYVHDKRDLMRGVAEHEFDELIQRLERIVDADPIERIRQSSRAYIGYALENPELFKTMFLFPPDLSVAAATGEELPNATRAFELSLTAISEAIESGAFRAVDPVMAGLTIWTATHGCATVLLLGFALDDNGRDALIASVIDTMIAGFAA